MPKKLTGYGVTGDELVLSELSGNEDEEYDEFDGDMDTTSDDEGQRSFSSGIESSPPSSPTISCQHDGKSTNSVDTLTKPTDSGSKPEVICIDDEEPKRETQRARMPSIPSLVNRTQVHPQSYTNRSARNEAENPEVIFIEDHAPQYPNLNPQAVPTSGNAAEPICIDAEEDRDKAGCLDRDEDELSQHDDPTYESGDSMSEADPSDDEEMDQDDDENLDEELDELEESDDEDDDEHEKISDSKDATQKGGEGCSLSDVMDQKPHNSGWGANPINRILHPYLPCGLREGPCPILFCLILDDLRANNISSPSSTSIDRAVREICQRKALGATICFLGSGLSTFYHFSTSGSTAIAAFDVSEEGLFRRTCSQPG